MKKPLIIAGPCAVEGLEEIISMGKAISNYGADCLRYMIYKPRTNPNSFQGVGDEGLDWIERVRGESMLRLVTEVMDTRDVEKLADKVDILQIGSRNMQNYALLKEVGQVGKKVILKRGPVANLSEIEGSFEYLSMSRNDVYLCERGVSTRASEGYARNLFDINLILDLKKRGYNVIADPSHGTGRSDLVKDASIISLFAGADGLELEVHKDPKSSISDGKQSLNYVEFFDLMLDVSKFLKSDFYGLKYMNS